MGKHLNSEYLTKEQFKKSIRRKAAGERRKRVMRAPLLLPLLACLVLTPATAGAEGNIGNRATEDCDFEWWGVSRTDLNPDGMYAYYVQNVDGIMDVMGWHDTNDGPANSNMLTIGGNVNVINAYGGYASNGYTKNNVVIVNSGTISGNVVGGYAEASRSACDNKVTINGGTIATGDKAVIGGIGKDVSGNEVTVNGGTVGEIYGGCSSADSGTVTGNTVTIKGGTVGDVYGGQSATGAASGNEVTIGGTAKVSGKIYGGSGETDASGNTVTIREDAVLDRSTCIYGGAVYYDDNVSSDNDPHTANNNTVNIFKAITVAQISGGVGKTTTGNTLNLGAAGVRANETVTGFQTIALTGDVAWTKDATVLSATQFMNAYGRKFSGKMDISGVAWLSPAAAPGTMTLLASETDLDFAGLKLAYDAATRANPKILDESNDTVEIYSGETKESANGVTLGHNSTHTVSINRDKTDTYKNVTYTVASGVNTVSFGTVEWQKGATLLDRSDAGYNYAGVTALGTNDFEVSYASPENVAAGDSMTLLKANATLKDMAEQMKQTAYSYTPVTGVTVDANITGKLAAGGGAVTYTAAANRAGRLTFTNVDWKDSGALLTRPKNIIFAGADVDTTKIHFQNINELGANRKMTLVSDFGDSVGTITGTKYTVGAGLEGEGAASLSGSDLIFTAKTGTGDLQAQEQAHNALMAMEADIAVLAAGSEHVVQALAGLADDQNAGPDGTVTAASVGGSRSRYETGSHVDSHNWNVAVAVGSKRDLEKGSLEWGVFGEYGKASYTLHGDAGRGDGDSHYAGGGLMAKWTNKHDVYTEASVRMGRLSDTANNLLRDAAGNGYGYDVHANYFGAHVGIGKIIHYKGGKSLDVYGKYFFTKRDGVDFASGGNNYSLDSVASSILRAGARYGTTDKKWNWYGGLAYEYEFDGKSKGFVDGVAIRSASIKGGSVRGEIGMRMNATKDNPWQADINIYGYGGRHRGFGGSVNVAYMF